jgi:hypothetical protein
MLAYGYLKRFNRFICQRIIDKEFEKFMAALHLQQHVTPILKKMKLD